MGSIFWILVLALALRWSALLPLFSICLLVWFFKARRC